MLVICTCILRNAQNLPARKQTCCFSQELAAKRCGASPHFPDHPLSRPYSMPTCTYGST